MAQWKEAEEEVTVSLTHTELYPQEQQEPQGMHAGCSWRQDLLASLPLVSVVRPRMCPPTPTALATTRASFQKWLRCEIPSDSRP